jgi:hypothetical protein
MSHAFADSSLGLKLKGYSIVPNNALETKIGIYTADITQSILQEHPEFVDGWLEKLHQEYIAKKKACEFDSDPVACFNLSIYEEFEKHLESWNDGGLIAISLPGDRVIRVSKRPLFSVSKEPAEVCDVCQLSFGSVKELVKHYSEKHPAMIERVTIPI